MIKATFRYVSGDSQAIELLQMNMQEFMDEIQKNLINGTPLLYNGPHSSVIINLAQVTNISIEEVPK